MQNASAYFPLGLSLLQQGDRQNTTDTLVALKDLTLSLAAKLRFKPPQYRAVHQLTAAPKSSFAAQ